MRRIGWIVLLAGCIPYRGTWEGDRWWDTWDRWEDTWWRDTWDRDTADDSGTDTDDAAFTPHVFYVDATFGWDPVAGEIVPYTFEGTLYPIELVVRLADARAFTTGDDDWICTVALSTTDALTPTSSMTGSGPVLTFLLPADAEVDDGCEGVDSAWGDLGTAMRQWTWGYALDPVEDDVFASLEEAYGSEDDWEETWAPAVLGGGPYTDAGSLGFVGGAWGFGYDVDPETMEVLYDEEAGFVLHGSTEVFEAEQPPAGVYALQGWYGQYAEVLE